MPGRGFAFVAAALVATAVSLWLVHDHTRGDSLSADEPIHILSGYFQVVARTAIVNIEHPPLMKELAGLALTTLALPPPPSPMPMGAQFSAFGHDFFFRNTVSPDAIAAAARAPFLGVLAVLLLLVFFAARRRYGAPAALFALALLAFDPNFVAHAGLVHTDVGAALGFFAAVLAWDGAMRHPSPGRFVAASLALGFALVTKFSCVYLIPIFLLQGLWFAGRNHLAARTIGRGVLALAAVGAGALVVVAAVYGFVGARMDTAAQRSVIHEMVAGRGALGLSRGIEAVASVSPALGHYLGGLASVARQNAVGGGVNYLFGKVSEHGFPQYFFVAFLVKSSLAFLIALALTIWSCVRDPAARADAPLWLVPVGVLFLASMGSSYNIGIRHLLPVYPFLALAAAGTLSRLAKDRARLPWAFLVGALPLVSAVELARIHPYELSYFNPLAGGPVGGRRILSDSNVDWGLDLKRLAGELARRGVHDPTVVYFGGDDVPYRIGVPDFAQEPFVRGRVVAISAFALALGPEFYAYHGQTRVSRALERLRREIASRGRLLARAGYSIDLYEISLKGTPPS